MKLNSIVFKMMMPLVFITIFVVGVTLVLTQIHLKKVVEDIFIDMQMHHLEELYALKIQNVVSEIKSAGVEIAGSRDVQNFILSKYAQDSKISQEVKQELSDLKKLYKLDTIYILNVESKKFFDENGFIKTLDTSAKENSWFSKILHSQKNFLIDTDVDLAGRLYVRLDRVIGSVSNPVAFVGGKIDVTHIFEIALENFHRNKADVTILTSANIVHASFSNKEVLNIDLHKSGLKKEKISAIEEAKKSNKNLASYVAANGESRNLLLIPIENVNWTIIVDFSKEEFLDSLSGVYDRIIIGGVTLLFLILLIGSMTFAYLVSRPLKKISSAVGEFDYKSDFSMSGYKSLGYELDMIYEAFRKNSVLLRKTIDKHRYNEELLRSIIEAADDLIFYKDTKNIYLGGNSAYEKWSSKNIEEIIGKTDYEMYPEEIANHHVLVDRQVIEQKRTILMEEKFQRDDGSAVILQIKKSPFYDKDGNVMGVVVVARDMTIIKDMEQALLTLNSSLEKKIQKKTLNLQKTNEILEGHVVNLEIANLELLKAKTEALRAAQARSNFITAISHELRTPLNAIINFTDQVIEDFDEMLEDRELQDDAKKFMQRVLVNSRHLLSLINDLLEFTKAEAGKIDYKIGEHDLNIIARTAYNNTCSLLNGTDVKFNLKLSQMPIIAKVDSRRFLQIILNLLSNAIKFTKEGKIELRSFEENGFAFIEVEDSGKGIPLEKQYAIFEPFMQVESTDSGTGLGLGLVKRMCNDMGIEISFTSIENKGSIFILKKSVIIE